MSSPPPSYVAVDIGASGGRVMRGRVEDGRISVEPVHRFPNAMAEREGHLRWDVNAILHEITVGLECVPEAASVGIDTWGVDYALLGRDGQLLADPVAYRDARTGRVIDHVHDVAPPEVLYGVTGIQFLPFNTVYQLAAEHDSPLWDRTAHTVLLPDFFAYQLTGELRTELTNASTTGLLDVRGRCWSTELFDRLGYPNLFPPIETPGAVRGTTALGLPVTTVGSHDTASAVVGVPATTDRFGYIVSGTWSLVGIELAEPVLHDAARRANFTNEAGVDGRIRFLRNVGGLWLLQECLRAWGRTDLEAMLAAAAEAPPCRALIDVDDPTFIPPGAMPDRVAAAAGQPDWSPPEIARCILESLAVCYARVIEQAAVLSGRSVDVIHVVGGGAQNALLCQLTADAAGLAVLAGPVEATAIGNTLVQARAQGAVASSLDAIRAQLASSTPIRRYEPS